MRLSILAALLAAASAHPAREGEDLEKTLVARKEAVPYMVDEACRLDGSFTDKKYSKILNAVKWARSMADTAVKEWWDEGKHGEVAATYLGIPDDKDYKENKYAKIVYENLRRVSLLDEAIPFASRYIFVSCKDQWKMCSDKLEGSSRPIAGYAKNTDLIDGRHYDIVLCPTWFTTDPPMDIYNEWNWSDALESVSMDFLENDANKMLHEMMHLKFITEDRPEVVDMLYQGSRAYGPKVVAEWVGQYKAKTADVVRNADSYAQFVNAIFFKNQFGFLPPPGRDVDTQNDTICYENTPEYVDKDLVLDYVKSFCGNLPSHYKPRDSGDWDDTYAKGYPEQVKFIASWSNKAAWGADVLEKKCKEAFKKIVNGCDPDSRWKHGGAQTHITIGTDPEDVYSFSLNPSRERPSKITEPDAGCSMHYKFWKNKWRIFGGLWAGNESGKERLRSALDKCGLITEWNIEYFDEPGEGKWEWKATGAVEIGPQMWGCFAKQIHNAGGPKIRCTGS